MNALVKAPDLKAWAADVFVRLGLREDDSVLVADSLVEADLRGVGSHGVQRMTTYARGLQAGTIVARPEVRVVQDSGWAAVVDGGGGMGQIAAQFATSLALQRAASGGGHGAVAVRRSGHCGAMAYWAMQAAAARAIGFGATNAGINMMPTGGREKLVGNNPLAYAIPTGRETPIVLDMATSVVAGGKLDVARLKVEPIPLGWALDAAGEPTTDPVAARQGALLPLGGPKGYGLAVVLDVLCGVLAGGRFGKGLGEPGQPARGPTSPAQPPGSAHFFEVYAVEAFTPYADFLERIGALIDQLHDCPPAPGSPGVVLPGELEHRLRERRLQEGLPLEELLLRELNELGQSLSAPRLQVA